MRRLCLMAAAILIYALVGLAPLRADPPRMPPTFDLATVQQLIGAVDRPQNDTVLKMGYFARRGRQPLKQRDGLALLETAAQAEPSGSRRWFYLEAVLGFAGLHIGPDTKDDGYKAYDALFSRANQAGKVGAAEVTQRSIYEYVSVLPSDLGVAITSDAQALPVLAKAFSAYLEFLRHKNPGPLEIPWAAAVQKTKAADRLAPLIDAALHDPTMPKTYTLYRTASAVYAATKPNLALALLRQAKVKLSGDALQLPAFYGDLVDLLLRLDKTDEAIAAQQELIRQTGAGRARLALLYRQKNDRKSYDAVLTTLATPEANEADILAAAAELRSYARQDIKNRLERDRAMTLLSSYLSSKRVRNPEMDLRARLMLAQIDMEAQKMTEAKAVLDAALPPPVTSPPQIGLFWREVQRLQQQLNAVPAAVER